MYIQSLSIRNLRCFRDVQLQLRYPGEPHQPDTPFPNVTLLLGNNGAGKTTALKSAAIGVLARVIARSGFVPYHLVRRGGEKEAAIEVAVVPHEQDVVEGKVHGQSISLLSKIMRDGDYEELLPQKGPFLPKLFEDNSPAWFIVGYGATRRVETGEYSASSEERRRRLRYRRVAGLFEEGVTLTPLTAWLPIFQRERPEVHDAALRLINRLLPEELHFHGEMERESRNLGEREYLFEHRGLSIPFGALSDGYRAYVGWVADLAYHLASVAKPGDELWDYSGVVLIDEIDLHLHPEWQRCVVERVATALPRMQLVFSTHSPIVAGTLKRENILVTELASDGSSEVRQLEEHIYGLNADQVLVSSYFNLNTTRAPGFERQMRQLTQRAWEGDKNAAVEMLRQLAGKTGQDQ
jgi:predicted ATPase